MISIGQGLNGNKRVKDAIDKAKIWRKQRELEGWRDTPFGLMSRKEIQEAGFWFDNTLEEVWDYDLDKMVSKPRGYSAIPTERYITTTNDKWLNYQVGSVIYVMTKKFQRWFEKRLENQPQKESIDDKIEKMTRQPVQGQLVSHISPNEINVDTMVF